MRPDTEVHHAVSAMGFVLVRQHKHRIYKHPCGAVLTTSVSPSDRRATQNCLHTARRLLRAAGLPA